MGIECIFYLCAISYVFQSRLFLWAEIILIEIKCIKKLCVIVQGCMCSVLRGYQRVIMSAALQHRVQMRRRAPELKICIPCLTALFAFTVIDSLEACLKEAAGVLKGPVTPCFPPASPPLLSRHLALSNSIWRPPHLTSVINSPDTEDAGIPTPHLPLDSHSLQFKLCFCWLCKRCNLLATFEIK